MTIAKHLLRGILVSLIASLLPYASSTEAKDMSSLYDSATLREWGQRYQRGILRNYEAVIRPGLTRPEKQKLADVKFSFPLRGEGNDPSEFYATSPPPTVYMPILSLKFSHDMSLAIAWLQLNRFAIETAFEYITMLKYKDRRDLGGRFPPPLEALKIPAGARQDRAVERLTDKIFDSAMAFILLHELGHLYYDHPGYKGVRRADARRNEAEADRFALEIYRRLGMNPTGMALYFIASAHAVANRADYGSNAAYESALKRETHPLTENRLRSIADSLRNSASDFARGAPNPRAEVRLIKDIANKLSKMADFLGDRELQRFNARIGSTTTLGMLRPRRPGELPSPEPTMPLASPSQRIPFHGSYSGDIGLPDGSVPIKTFLRRQGNEVNGEYYYGAGQGLLRGDVQGNTLSFKWTEGPETGYGQFRSDRTR